MTGSLLEGIRDLSHYRTQIAVGLPLLGGALVVATTVLMPRGKGERPSYRSLHVAGQPGRGLPAGRRGRCRRG